MADSPVSPQTLLAIIRAARPNFRNAADRLAYAVHAYMLASGYKLVGVGGSDTGDAALPERTAPEVSTDGWQRSNSEYVFQYVDDTGSRSPTTIKALPMNDKLLVYLLMDSDMLEHLELDIPHFITDDQDLARTYRNLEELTQLLDRSLKATASGPKAATKATPALEATQEAAVQIPREEQLREGPPLPGRIPNLAPHVGDADLFPPELQPPGRMPGLDPFGGGMRPHLGPGGMLVGPNDPMFAGRRPADPWAGPQGIPGVHWDPIRPPGLPGFNPPDVRPRPGQVHPDIMPPGPGSFSEDMYG